MSDKRFNTVRATVCDVAIADIDTSRNHRIAQPGDEARIKSLMESIAASGQLQRLLSLARHRHSGVDHRGMRVAVPPFHHTHQAPIVA